ncbi:MAG: hypothetical protein K2N65_01890 [Anaeroplasmataceae bacterium]|nr:hypothetical protein [Anaeroplasmataceae bacterium]
MEYYLTTEVWENRGMKLILYFGHTGTTEKAAYLLQQYLNQAEVLDGRVKHKIDYSKYDGIIFGINVRIGKLNKAFLKFYKKYKKQNLNLPCSAFVVAGDSNLRSTYMNLVRNILPEDSYVGFFGGEFNLTYAKGITKRILKNCIEKFQEQDLPLPQLIPSAIQDFAMHIVEYIEVHN